MLDERLIQHPGKLFLDGRWAEPSTSATIDLLNCATEALVETVAEAADADVERAVSAAREAFDRGPWPQMSHEERATYLRAIADELDRRADRHARIWTTESGLLLSHSRSRMQGLSDTYRFYADLAGTYPFQERHVPQSGGSLALVVREPVGVVAAIVPWNGAAGLITDKVAPALLAGCTVVLKASPEAPGAAYLLAEVCRGGRPARRASSTSSPRTARSPSARAASGRRQDHLHRLDRGGPPDRVDLRRADRALHARARRQVGRGRSSTTTTSTTAAATIVAARAFLTGQVCSSLDPGHRHAAAGTTSSSRRSAPISAR